MRWKVVLQRWVGSKIDFLQNEDIIIVFLLAILERVIAWDCFTISEGFLTTKR
jgi:hypothetical protein